MTFINDVLWFTGLAWWLVVAGAALMSIGLQRRNRRRLESVRLDKFTIGDHPLTDELCRYGRSGPDVV